MAGQSQKTTTTSLRVDNELLAAAREAAAADGRSLASWAARAFRAYLAVPLSPRITATPGARVKVKAAKLRASSAATCSRCGFMIRAGRCSNRECKAI